MVQKWLDLWQKNTHVFIYSINIPWQVSKDRLKNCPMSSTNWANLQVAVIALFILIFYNIPSFRCLPYFSINSVNQTYNWLSSFCSRNKEIFVTQQSLSYSNFFIVLDIEMNYHNFDWWKSECQMSGVNRSQKYVKHYNMRTTKSLVLIYII